MHGSVRQFLNWVRTMNRDHFRSGKVLEVGSKIHTADKWEAMSERSKRILWKNPRVLFGSNVDYIGVDAVDGEGVDRVGFSHLLNFPDQHFNTILCLEMLEHDPYWQMSVTNMRRMLKPDGLLVITCATQNRPKHDVPTDGPLEGYYRNITQTELADLVMPMAKLFFQCGRNHWDLLMYGKDPCPHWAQPNPPA